MGYVPLLAQDPAPVEEQPVAPPVEEAPPPAADTGYVPMAARDDAPAQPAPQDTYVPEAAQEAPPPTGPVSGAINAVSNAVSDFVPDAIEDPLSGWVPDVAAVTTALGQGDLGGAVAPILDYANRPFEYGSARQGERALDPNRGQVPTPQEVLDDPSAIYDVVPGFWNTGGPGAWAVGSDIDTWAEQNPQQASDAYARGGGQAVYEDWVASSGIERTPAGVDSPFDDEQYSGGVLDRIRQGAGELGEFGGSVKDSARSGALTPFLKGMVADIGNDPSFAGQIGLGLVTGGLGTAGVAAGRAGMPGLASALGRASTAGRLANRAADVALDPVLNSIGATMAPATRGVRNLGGLLDKSPQSRQAIGINLMSEAAGEYLNATPRTLPAAAPAPAATPGARPPALNGAAVAPQLTPQPTGVAPLRPTNTLYNPPTTPTTRTLPAGRGDPYSRPVVTGATNAARPSVVRPANTGTPVPDALAVRGGVWRDTTGTAIAQRGEITTSLRATTRRIYDEMMTADADTFWDRFDAVSHTADVDLGSDGFYARWRAAMRQGLYLLDDWPEARVARQMPGVKLPDGSIDWAEVGRLAQSGNKDAQRAMGGKRSHDLFVHRIAGSTDPDREVYNLLVTFHLDQHAGRFSGNQYGTQYWRQRAEQISEILRDAGYTPSPALLARLAQLNVGDLVASELAGRIGSAAMRRQVLASNGVLQLHIPGRTRPVVIDPTVRPYVGEFGQTVRYGDPALYQIARKRLDDLGLHDVALKIVDELEQGYKGAYSSAHRLITISRQVSERDMLSAMPSSSVLRTVDHEALHAMRDLGVLTREEWDELVAEAYLAKAPLFDMTDPERTFVERAKRQWARVYGQPEDTKRLPVYEEEAVAELWAWWRQGKYVSPKSETLLGRMYEFLRNLYAFLSGNPDVTRILDQMDAGIIGRRARGTGETSSEEILRILDDETQGIRYSNAPGPGIPTRTQQVMGAQPPPPAPVNVAPTPQQRRISTAFGNFSAAQRQRMFDHMPDDVIMDPQAIPVSEAVKVRLDETMPDGFRFNDGSTSTATLRDVFDETARELDQWVEMAADPSLQVGRAAQEFDRLSKKFALDGDVLDATDLAGPQNESRRNDLIEYILRAAAENALPKAKRADFPGIETYQSFMDMRRRVQLYSYLNLPRFVVQQHVGNTISTAVGGKPGVALGIFTNLRDYVPVFRQLNEPGRHRTFADDLQQAMGGGQRHNVTQSNRAGLGIDVGGNLEQVSGPFGHIARLLAGKRAVNAGKINDTITRSEIYSDEVFKGYRRMNKDLARETFYWSQHYGMPYTESQINDLMQRFLREKSVIIDGNTGKPHTTLLGRTAKFEPVYSRRDFDEFLRTELPKVAPPTSTKASDPLELLIRRQGAEVSNNIKSIQNAAEAEVNRLAFDWMPNNFDAFLSNFTLYHFWMTRAGGLYVKQMLKNPWAMAAYGRMMDDFEAQLEALDGPDWMRGWFQFMNTPAGFTVWYSPTDLLSTLLTFADWQMDAGESPFDDLTWLGKMRNHIPFLLNPLLDFAAYAVGAYGPDAQIPDLIGLNRPATMATDLLNLANAEGLLPAWVRAAGIGVDAAGNPVPLQPKKLSELYARVGNGISSALKDVTGLRPVPIPNTAASQSRRIAYILEQNFRTDYPGLPQEDINRKVTDALADPGSAEYQRAWREEADVPYMTGDTPLPAWAEGALRTVLSPIQTYAGPEQQFLDSTMKGMEPSGDVPPRNLTPFTLSDGTTITADDLKRLSEEEFAALSTTEGQAFGDWFTQIGYENNAAKYGASKTVEGRVLSEQLDGYYDAGDPAINATKSTANGIYFGNASQPVTVGGVTYTPEEIAGFDEDTRKALANQYRDEQGVTWEMIEANDAQRDAYLDANPNVAAYLEWKNAAYDHAGGEIGYIQEQMALNPAYADYMARNNFDLQTGAVDYDHALGTDAFLASQGIAPTLYEPISSPTMEPLPAPKMQTVQPTTLLDVYPGPDASLEPFAQADSGFPMTLVEMQGDWAKVTIGGQEGYVDAGYLQNAPGGYQPEGLTGAIGGVVHGGLEPGLKSLGEGIASIPAKISDGIPLPDAISGGFHPENPRVPSEGGNFRVVQDTTYGLEPWVEGGMPADLVNDFIPDGSGYIGWDHRDPTGADYYGNYFTPETGGHGNEHPGTDIWGTYGTPVATPVRGTVVCTGSGSGEPGVNGFGCAAFEDTDTGGTGKVEIQIEGKPQSLIFGHMQTTDVAYGQVVDPGTILGGMGGMSEIPHIHVEARVWNPDGTYTIVDPTLMLSGYYG